MKTKVAAMIPNPTDVRLRAFPSFWFWFARSCALLVDAVLMGVYLLALALIIACVDGDCTKSFEDDDDQCDILTYAEYVFLYLPIIVGYAWCVLAYRKTVGMSCCGLRIVSVQDAQNEAQNAQGGQDGQDGQDGRATPPRVTAPLIGNNGFYERDDADQAIMKKLIVRMICLDWFVYQVVFASRVEGFIGIAVPSVLVTLYAVFTVFFDSRGMAPHEVLSGTRVVSVSSSTSSSSSSTRTYAHV